MLFVQGRGSGEMVIGSSTLNVNSRIITRLPSVRGFYYWCDHTTILSSATTTASPTAPPSNLISNLYSLHRRIIYQTCH